MPAHDIERFESQGVGQRVIVPEQDCVTDDGDNAADRELPCEGINFLEGGCAGGLHHNLRPVPTGPQQLIIPPLIS